MTDRTALALQACQGLTDAELLERGAQGYRKMRDRKRKYAAAARILVAGMQVLQKQNAKAHKRIEELEAKLATLQQLDTPVVDTSEAAGLLAGIAKKGAA